MTTQTGKEEDYEDLPTRTPMRPAGLRNSPSTDQKKVRRRLVQGVAEPTRTTMTTEADLLRAMASAHPDEQARIMARIDALRQERRAALEAEQSALWHQMAYQPAKTASVAHTAQSDWLNGVAPSDRYDGSVARTAARVWHARISDGVKADRGEYLEQAKGVAFRQASAHGEHARDFAMAFMAEAETLVPGSSRMDTIRQILESSQSQTVDGMLVDIQTANVLVQVFDALSPENQAKIDQVPLDKLVDWAWKRVGSKTAEADPSEWASDNFPDPTVHPPEDDTNYDAPPDPEGTFTDVELWDSIPETTASKLAQKAKTDMANAGHDYMKRHPGWEYQPPASVTSENDYMASKTATDALDEAAIDQSVRDVINSTYCPQCESTNYGYNSSDGATCYDCGYKWWPPPPYAQPKGAAKTAVSLTNVGFEGGIGSNTAHGYDSAGNKVLFRLSDQDAKDLAYVMTSDMAINFSGVDVDEADIIREGSKMAAGGSRRCQWCNKSISFSGGRWCDTSSGVDCERSDVGHSPSPREDISAPPKNASLAKTATEVDIKAIEDFINERWDGAYGPVIRDRALPAGRGLPAGQVWRRSLHNFDGPLVSVLVTEDGRMIDVTRGGENDDGQGGFKSASLAKSAAEEGEIMPPGSVRISRAPQGHSSAGRIEVFWIWGPSHMETVYKGYDEGAAAKAALDALTKAHATPEGANAKLYGGLGAEASLTKSARALYEIAEEISVDWKNVNYAAVPYLEAMYELESITDMYYQDPAKQIVAYFLSNASSWRGETAKRVKAELKAMLTGKALGSKTAAQWQKMEGHDGYNDQQADLTGGFYAEVGPDSGGRWSWTIISPEGDEVDGGVEDDEGSAKSMAEGWRATASAPPRNASKTAGTATCPSCGASNHGNAERCAHCGAIMGNSKDWTKKESAGYAPVPGEPFRWLGDPQWSQNTKSFRELFPDGVPMRDEDLTPEQKAFLDAKRPMASLSPQQAAFRNRVQASLASGSRRPFSDGKTAMPNPVDLGVKVGDIFYSSWGYDQTNVNFYEVTGLTGASVKVREVAQRVERSTPPQDYVVPVPGQYIGGEMTKRISGGIEGGYNRPSIRIDYSQTAWLWDGTPKYQTSTGWGH